MGDLELSLDDIIKKKLGKNNTGRPRNNGAINKKPIRRLSDPNSRTPKNANVSTSKTFSKVRGGIAKNVRGSVPAVGIGDARLKIIQKQRLKITDAREKIGQASKLTDARLRLMKLRERRNITTVGILRSSLPEEQIVQRTIRPPTAFEDELMDFTNDVAYMTRNYPERAISDEEAYSYQFRSRQDMPIIYRTVENDMPPSRLYNQDKSLYSWTNPRSSPIVIDDMPNIPINRLGGRMLQTANFRHEERLGKSPPWDYDEPIVITKKMKPLETVGILKRSPASGGFHERETIRIQKDSPPSSATKSRGPAKTLSERFGNPSGQKVNLIKSRLESGDSNNKASSDRNGLISEPMGHRIVVSNLVPSVTHEDVKELFEDIGELLSSKVVRPGTAEVVYKLHKDAVKAVDVYHNRQLDGQPMKCLLVNNRSAIPISSKSSKLPERKTGKGIELDMTAFRKALHKKSTS